MLLVLEVLVGLVGLSLCDRMDLEGPEGQLRQVVLVMT